jgi:hypothetical protein
MVVKPGQKTEQLQECSTERTLEEKILLAKLILHIRDYVKAVMIYGKDFHNLPANSREHLSLNKSQGDRQVATLSHGRRAYKYLFQEQGNDFGLLPTCNELGFNGRTFRSVLINMTKADAKKAWAKFLRGEKKNLFTGDSAKRHRKYIRRKK